MYKRAQNNECYPGVGELRTIIICYLDVGDPVLFRRRRTVCVIQVQETSEQCVLFRRRRPQNSVCYSGVGDLRTVFYSGVGDLRTVCYSGVGDIRTVCVIQA